MRKRGGDWVQPWWRLTILTSIHHHLAHGPLHLVVRPYDMDEEVELDDFGRAAGWLSSNPETAKLPNEVKLEVHALLLWAKLPRLNDRSMACTNMLSRVPDRTVIAALTE